MFTRKTHLYMSVYGSFVRDSQKSWKRPKQISFTGRTARQAVNEPR